MTGPIGIHTFKDAVKDSFTTARSSKGAHLTDAAAHFDKEPFNGVGSAHAFPVGFGTMEEGQQLL